MKEVMPWQKQADIINKVSIVSSFEDALNQVLHTVHHNSSSVMLSFINAHALNLCFKNEKFANALFNSDILFRDGKGMEILYKKINRVPGANMNGTDFIPFLLKNLTPKKVALIGTTEPYLSRAAEVISANGHHVCFTKNGFSSFDDYINLIFQYKPEVVLLGMGMPRQEIFSHQLKNKISEPILIINGGAIIDFLGGKISRAPLWMRRSGTEWLYRLFLEPRRLFSRYVVGNILFLNRIRKIKKSLQRK